MFGLSVEQLNTVLSDKPGYFLVINGDTCQFNEFIDSISSNPQLLSESRTLFRYYEELQSGKKLPIKKFKQLTRDKSDTYPDYELISKHLRWYLVYESIQCGFIIFIAGHKKNQKEDIKKLRNLKRSFFTKGVHHEKGRVNS